MAAKIQRGRIMNVRTFLKELLFYFPIMRKLGDEDVDKLLNAYAEDIFYEINKWDGYNCDFQILLREIRSNYSYKEFPSIANIISYLPRAKVIAPKSVNYSGREGEIIKRKINGIIYEFTIVPSHWDKVKTISPLDQEIAQRTIKKGI